MQKIPTLYQRDPENRFQLLETITEGCEWVFEDLGKVSARRKYDGTCVMMKNGEWFARREVGKGKTPPEGFRQLSYDYVTGKRMGWEPIEQSSYYSRFLEAVEPIMDLSVFFGGVKHLPNGTFELIGPKINGNPENVPKHMLIRHETAETYIFTPFKPAPTFEQMRDYFATLAAEGIEGIVWHHEDGRMAKLKCRDFGYKVGSIAAKAAVLA